MNKRTLTAQILAGFLGLALVGAGSSCTKHSDESGNAVRIPVRGNIKGLDPANASDIYSGTAIAQIYDGLLRYQYLKRPYAVEGSLSDLPVITDNGLTYTFKIKARVKFQDDACFPGGKGRDVTAQDFIFSWKRLADPATQSDGFWIFDGKIKGLNEWVDGLKAGKSKYDTPVEGLTAPDANTLVVKLKKPYYQMLYVLTMPYSFAVPHEAVEKYGKEFLNHPVGTGAYAFESWVRGSKITLKRNPTYRADTFPSEGAAGDQEAGYLKDAGQKIPFADKLEVVEMVEDSPRWQNFMKGNIDFIEIPPDNYDSAIANKQMKPEISGKGIQLSITQGDDYTYTVLNMKDPILGKSKDLRHAISLAEDREGLINKFFNDHAIPAHGPVPPDISGYDKSYVNPYTKRDLAKAKELLKKAGYPDGKGLPEFTYEALSDSKARQMAEFFQQNMAAIGIKVVISANTWPQFQDKVKNSKAQIFGVAWTADYPDGQDFLQLFYSKNASPGPNDSNFVSAAFDKLYEKSLEMPPGEDRNKVYYQMRDIVVDEMPELFDAHRQYFVLSHGWMSNFKYSFMILDYGKYLHIDEKKKADLKAKL